MSFKTEGLRVQFDGLVPMMFDLSSCRTAVTLKTKSEPSNRPWKPWGRAKMSSRPQNVLSLAVELVFSLFIFLK